MKLSQYDMQRFWSFVLKEPKGHWLWQGASDGEHGKFWLEGKNRAASRVAMSFVRAVPTNKNVIRTCDKSLCINPAHHFVGTKAERRQMATLREKNCKLDIVIAAEVCAEHEAGWSTRELATKYDVAQSQIWKIIHKLRYAAAAKLAEKLKGVKS